MPTLAETLVSSGLKQAAESVTANPGSGLAVGAQIAQNIQETKLKREQLEQAKTDLRQKKIQEMTDDLQKAKNLSGKALQGYRQFLGNKAVTYKVDDIFDKSTLDQVTASPENMERFTVIRDDVLNGRMKLEEGIAKLKDPSQFYDITPNMLGDLYDASKTRVQANEAMNRAQTIQGGQNVRQDKQISSIPETELKKKVADLYAADQAAGGEAGANKRIEALQDAKKQLVDGTVKLGGMLKNVPYGSNLDVLARIDPKAKALVDRVRSSIDVKSRTGDPNPTERQIEQIYGQAIDTRLSNEENVKKIDAEIEKEKRSRVNARTQYQRFGFEAAPAPKKSFGDLSAAAQKLVIEKQMKVTGKTEAEVRKMLGGQ